MIEPYVLIDLETDVQSLVQKSPFFCKDLLWYSEKIINQTNTPQKTIRAFFQMVRETRSSYSWDPPCSQFERVICELKREYPYELEELKRIMNRHIHGDGTGYKSLVNVMKELCQ